MKAKSICAFVENKKGDFRQIVLTETQQEMLMDLICQLHNGSIKVRREIIGLKYKKQSHDRQTT